MPDVLERIRGEGQGSHVGDLAQVQLPNDAILHEDESVCEREMFTANTT